MRTPRNRQIGVLYDRDRPPEHLADFARAVEALGVDDLWVVEDLGWTGSMASAAVALAATGRIRVGISIAPAPLRNPALLAMELAALARMFPERLAAGIGHGVTGWMRQVGAATPHPLALLEETITAVRALLRGETVTLHGSTVHLDAVRLVHPPAVAPPVVAGVVRPRSLRLSGRVADGTVIAEGHGPAALTRALAQIAEQRPSDEPPHELIVLAFLGADPRSDAATAALRSLVAGQAGWLGTTPDEVFVAGGTAGTAADAVRSLWDAGAHTVVLRPVGDDPVGQLRPVLAALDR
ncbi:LLM class flavin-dependent oxidoreductase [Plantactinospora sp. CA-290183]|uniref:LLM class flavin-dependent oxidoreductase n=1 Tax=Plantactinospora sp. CA-290183 TaxID=3240006 RepID=UPI003D93EC03